MSRLNGELCGNLTLIPPNPTKNSGKIVFKSINPKAEKNIRIDNSNAVFEGKNRWINVS